MESSVGVDVNKEVEEQNAKVSVLIMDDDTTTTTTKITPKTPWKKFVCIAKKAQKTSPKMRQFIQKCLSYAVVQNRNKPDKLKSALRQIVLHAFGDHSH